MKIRYLFPLAFLLTAMSVGRRSAADEEFSLIIDPFTGAAELRNDSLNAVNLDGYLIKSPSALLNPEGWVSLQNAAVSGFRESSSDLGDRLGELNLFESVSILAGGNLSIGNPYVPFTPSVFGDVEPGLSTLNFTYSITDVDSALNGDIEFSARNTVVLVIDPSTGESSLQNQSAFDIEIDSYLVTSTNSVLSSSGWAPLSGSDASWTAASGRSDRLAEGNLFGSTSLPSGASLSLGPAIDPAQLVDEADVTLKFTTVGLNLGSIEGGVLFRSLSSVVGDCDGNGVIDIRDANCTNDADLDAFLAGLNPPSLRGDTNGDGAVQFADFVTLSSNFGSTGAYTDGDFTKDGNIGFADFVLLSSRFGTSAGVAAAVPEPNSVSMTLLGLVALIARFRKQRT